ncbi:ABC transporter permease [Pelagicoccus enzymogenes]|uniref:ABC transporter permease n=1 Tax=Pelagicoccus enzymogenes TaxID=2773457 RepID=UPI00280E0547|nr:ABC transporter permease [Pelagicoccus enzymogenes]MDQ8200551.1 ABC transporter permease [Pelagicoccus enzymogenes]
MPLPIPANLRGLAKRPAFTLTAVGIVALGVALATTAASIVDALVFRPIPVERIDQLYRVQSGIYSGTMTPPDARELFDRTDFPALGYHHRYSVEYNSGNHAGLLVLCELQGDPFRVLNWKAAQGRLLQPDDFQLGSEPVAVLSHAFWENDLGGPGVIVGESLLLNGKSFRVVGVLPPEHDRIHRTTKPHAWTSLAHTFDSWLFDGRNAHWQRVIARLPSPEQLPAYQTQLNRVTAYLKQAFPAESQNLDFQAVPEIQAGRESSAEAAQQSYIIVGLVASLLLVTCFNVGNMLLANAYRREREFAIRRSVGASPLQIVKSLLGESFGIALLGGVAGVLFSLWLVDLADQLPLTRSVDVRLDTTALFIALGTTIATGLISGLAPAWHLARENTADSLKRGAKDSNVAFAAKFLVVAQVALSAALLTSTFLYTQSLKRSLEFDPGYNFENITYFRISVQSIPEGRRYQAAKELRQAISSIPGVTHVGYGSTRPLGGFGSSHIKTTQFDPGIEEDNCTSHLIFVSPDYLAAQGLTLLEGRDFLDTDDGWPLKVAIVNQAFGERFFPEDQLIGQEFWPWGDTGEPAIRIVGVVKDFAPEPWAKTRPLMILPAVQPRMVMYIRSEGPPSTIRDSLEKLVHDPKNEYVAQEIRDFSYARQSSLSNERGAFYVLAVLAICGLALSSAGIWYTTRQFVRLSRKELSIRSAIGATPGSLLVLTLSRSLRLVSSGLLIGCLFSFFASRLIQSSINGVEATDARPYLLMAACLIAVATVATYLPARAALKADPREALSEV